MKNSLLLLFLCFFLSFAHLVSAQANNEDNYSTTYYNSEESPKEEKDELHQDESKEEDGKLISDELTAETSKESSPDEVGEEEAVSKDESIVDAEVESSQDEDEIDEATLATIQSIEEKAITNIPYKRLDNEIFLFMMGYGEAKLMGTFGFEFFRGVTLAQVQSPIFLQEANLSLLFLMKRRWYFGINYKDKALDSSIYMGYINEDDAIKKHVRLGNKGINFPNIYPFIRGGKTAHLSPGASATLEGERWRFDSAIRYDSSEKRSRIFYGKSERIEQKTSIFSWQKSQYFYIPHPTLLGKAPRVYVKDSERGDWRPLEKNAFYLANREGVLVLHQSYPYGVAINVFDSKLVHDAIKDVKAHFAGTSILNEIDDDPYIDIEGIPFLILKNYKQFSPFEIASIYTLHDLDARSEAYIVEKIDGTPSSHFSVKFDYIEHPFQVLNSLSSKTKTAHIVQNGKAIFYSDATQRYPFAIENYQIYKPSDKINEQEATLELLSYLYSPVSDYVLPKDANADDIEVYKNGLPIADFTFDSSTRILRLNAKVFPSDKIEIRWSESKKYSKTGKVKIATGVQYRPLEWLTLFLANSTRISVNRENKELQDEYTASTGADVKVKAFEAGVHFAIQTLTNRGNKTSVFSKNHFYTKYEDDASYSIFSHPKLAIDFDVNREEKISLHSNMSSSINVWKIALNGSLSLQNKTLGKNVVESAGHGVSVPLWYFYMDESFFINRNLNFLSRSNNIKWKKIFNIEHFTHVTYESAHTQSGITSSIEPIIPHSKYGNFFLQLKLALNQKYKHNKNHAFDEQKENYLQSWKRSLLDTYSSGSYDALNRNENMSFIFNWSHPIAMNETSGFNVEGVNMEARLRSENSSLASKKDAIFVQLRLPFTYNEVFITPFWERSGEKYFKKKVSASYKSDFESMFSSLKDEYWIFSVPILYDLFDPTLRKKMQTVDQNILYSFSNTYGLDVSRLLSHTQKDLYTPFETSFSFTRMTKTQHFSEVSHQYYKLNFGIKYKAEDVFIKMKKGADDAEEIPLNKERNEKTLQFFEGDELVRHYEASFLFSQDGGLNASSSKNLFFNFSLNTMHRLMFYDMYDNKTGLENKLKLEVETLSSRLRVKTWKEEVSFIYSYQGRKSLINMLFARFSNFELLDIREEKLSIAIFQEVYAKHLGYKLTFSHTQKTKIGENGEIKMFVDASVFSTNRPSVKVEFTLGLAGKVEY